MQQPLISIVVPSFNQAQYLGEALQSLLDQNYPRLEVIIQDGDSNDGSVALAQEFTRRYPDVFRLFVEKDSGQADALNRGFARTHGDVLGFLNSDDTLFPGTLLRVAEEIDPSRARYIVMGRCLFTGKDSRYVGVEHPAEFVSHFEQLAIWKRGYNTIPQPSVFWHRSVWERCGPFDINEHHALDYDLFCRFSKHYRFHRVDELWSTYRMHADSKSSQRTEAEVLALSIEVSRKHWGSPFSPLRWRCEISYWLYRRHFHEHARHHARRAEQAFRDRRYGAALWELLATLAYSPQMARVRLLNGWFSAKQVRFLQGALLRTEGFTGRYADNWIGPHYREELAVPAQAKRLVLYLRHQPQGRFRKKQHVEFFLNGVLSDARTLGDAGAFVLGADVTALRGRKVTIDVRSGRSFVPRRTGGASDKRRLSVILNELSFET
jgi:glycosyltransferase involved in cell wall biosynthesis